MPGENLEGKPTKHPTHLPLPTITLKEIPIPSAGHQQTG